MWRSLFAVPLFVLLLVPAAQSEQSSLSRCEAPAAPRKVVKDEFHWPEFDRLPYADQLERKRLVLSGLMTRYPREIEPYNIWIEAAREDQLLHPELLAELQKEYKSRAAAAVGLKIANQTARL